MYCLFLLLAGGLAFLAVVKSQCLPSDVMESATVVSELRTVSSFLRCCFRKRRARDRPSMWPVSPAACLLTQPNPGLFGYDDEMKRFSE